MKHDHVPMFCKARPVPYSMKGKGDTELDKLVEQGVLKPVQHSDYASPIVSVLKPDGSVRICADYKRTQWCRLTAIRSRISMNCIRSCQAGVNTQNWICPRHMHR